MNEGFPPREPPPEPGERRWHYILAVLLAAALIWLALASREPPAGGSTPQTFGAP
jgi:hypothetical protein